MTPKDLRDAKELVAALAELQDLAFGKHKRSVYPLAKLLVKITSS